MGKMPTMQGDRSGSSRAASLAHTVLLGTGTITFCHGPAVGADRECQGTEAGI